jgi:hypothetical protein
MPLFRTDIRPCEAIAEYRQYTVRSYHWPVCRQSVQQIKYSAVSDFSIHAGIKSRLNNVNHRLAGSKLDVSFGGTSSDGVISREEISVKN